MRGKRENIELYGVIPGPLKHRDQQTYLEEFVDEMVTFWEDGYTVWDEYRQETRTVKGVLWATVHDQPGSKDIMCQCDKGKCAYIV